MGSSYRLPREFVLEILCHNLLNYRNRVSPGEVAGFFEHKAEQSQVVKNWAPETGKKLRQVMLRFLTECGLLQTQKDFWLITPIPLSPELRAHVSKEPECSDFAPSCLTLRERGYLLVDELQKRLDYFAETIQKPHFLQRKGLSNEIW
jgi:hypothetical protein